MTSRTLRTPRELRDAGLIAPEQVPALDAVAARYAIAIPPALEALIGRNDPHDPIGRQFVPDAAELDVRPEELADPIGDNAHSPVEGIVHRYPDRVLFLVTDRCASYCRYCTRSRVVSGVGEQELELDFDRAIEYLQKHTEVRDVLLSGGDALLLSDARLRNLLSRLRAIEHIEFLRIGSRVPIFLPATAACSSRVDRNTAATTSPVRPTSTLT